MSSFPATIIVVHPRERRSKCSVEPLRDDPRFEFWKYPYRNDAALPGCIRLGLGGPLLSPEDAGHQLLVLDGTWRYASVMEADYESLPVRSLPPTVTAYPRVSRTYEDPAEGLATIEAIYAAWHCLGRDVSGLLDQYYWAEQFLALNPHLTGGKSA